MMWYGLLLLVPFIVRFGTVHIHIFFVLPLTSSYSSFPWQVEVPPLVTSGVMVKKVVTAPSAATLGVEEEVGQVAKDAQPVLPLVLLAVQDPKALQPSIP